LSNGNDAGSSISDIGTSALGLKDTLGPASPPPDPVRGRLFHSDSPTSKKKKKKKKKRLKEKENRPGKITLAPLDAVKKFKSTENFSP